MLRSHMSNESKAKQNEINAVENGWSEYRQIPCKWCGELFWTQYYKSYTQCREVNRRMQLYCSDQCANKAKADRRKKRRERQRRMLPFECPECGQVFIPNRMDQRYCSVACKQKAYRKRKAVKE